MDPRIIAAVISAAITTVGILLAYTQWRRDFHIKIEQLRDEVTAELIQQRVKPYSDFITKLEPMSMVHHDKIKNNPKLVYDFVEVFQGAIYGPAGLLASSDTRQLLVYARWGCVLFSQGNIEFDEWHKRIWAVHLAIRSDLGIVQPNWPSEIERLRKQLVSKSSQTIAERVESFKHLRYDS